MKNGDIYNFWDYRIQILMFDKSEVSFLILNKDDISENINRKTIGYYSVSKDFFVKKAEFQYSLELSKKEIELHKPFLPMRLNCIDELFWTNQPFENINDFSNYIQLNGIKIEELDGLKESKIIIVPMSQQLSFKKPILIENKTGFFTGVELLYNCFNIQSDYVKIEKPYFSKFRLIPDGREEKRLSGIGIYRLGIRGNIPSYYLGGEISMIELESDKSLIVEK